MQSQTITIPCNAYEIVADWYQGSDDQKIILVLPGYTSSRRSQARYMRQLVADTGLSALVIDYSGHGDSPFELSTTRPAQHLLEVVNAFDYITAGYPNATIYVMGSSYGGFLAAHLSQYRQFQKLILRAPAMYAHADFYTPWLARLADEDAYRDKIIAFRANRKLLDKQPLLRQASGFSGQTYVAVHGADEIVPAQTTDAYIDAFKAAYYRAPGFTHSIDRTKTSPADLDNYWSTVASWLSEV